MDLVVYELNYIMRIVVDCLGELRLPWCAVDWN